MEVMNGSGQLSFGQVISRRTGPAQAQGHLDSASESVRSHERRVRDVSERLKLAQSQLREQQARAGELDLDITSRDAKIERLREQQQNSNYKQYQAFLTEINTEKIDKGKAEDELLKSMEQVEKAQAEVSTLSAQLHGEQKKLEETRQQLAGTLSQLQEQVEVARPARDEALKAVPPKAREIFERLSDRYEGEAMSAISKPDRRREEYVCTACNMSLVVDIYNRLHSRNDPVVCPNCRRLLFIPADLPIELAVHKPRERRERELREPQAKGGPAVAAHVGRQSSAADISRSISAGLEADAAEPQESAEAAPTDPAPRRQRPANRPP